MDGWIATKWRPHCRQSRANLHTQGFSPNSACTWGVLALFLDMTCRIGFGPGGQQKRSRSSFSQPPPGPMRFQAIFGREKIFDWKNKGFWHFHYLIFFSQQIRIVLSDGFFLEKCSVWQFLVANPYCFEWWIFALEKCSVWQTLSMKYNVFVLLSLFNKMSDWVCVSKNAVISALWRAHM